MKNGNLWATAPSEFSRWLGEDNGRKISESQAVQTYESLKLRLYVYINSSLSSVFCFFFHCYTINYIITFISAIIFNRLQVTALKRMILHSFPSGAGRIMVNKMGYYKEERTIIRLNNFDCLMEYWVLSLSLPKRS